jgi:hypothetical protein
MAQIPRPQNSQPIFSGVNVSSGAEGYEAFAKTLGGFAKVAAEHAKELGEEQSNAHLLHDQNNVADTITGAHINMIDNPGNALKIAEQSRDNIDMILEKSSLNKGDRAKLQSLSNHSLNQIDLLAAQTAHKQMLVDTSVTLNSEVPKALMDIDRYYLSGNPDAAHARQDTLLAAVNSAFKIGAISAKQYENINKGIQGTIQSAQYKMEMAGKGDATAYDYHKANSTIYGSVNTNIAATPTNQYVSDNASHYDSEASYKKAQSDMYRYGHITNIANYSNKIKPAKWEMLHAKWEGVREANALLMSGADYIKMDKDFTDLQSNQKTGLSLREEGKFGRLQNHYDRLKNGDFITVMKENPLGAKIHQDRISSDTAIKGSGLSDPEKVLKLKENDDWERQQLINLGQALHIDPKYIKAMDKESMAPFKAGFIIGGNPGLVTANLKATDPSLHGYIADSMDNQAQSATVLLLAQGGESITQNYANDMIRANQEGIDLKLVGAEEDNNKFGNIAKALANDPTIHDILMYQTSLPYDVNDHKDQTLPDGTITALTKTIIFQAKREGDYGVAGLPRYISNAATQLKKANVIYQDQNSRINNATLKYADADLRAIGIYAKDQAYQHAKSEMEPMEFLDFFDRSPLMLINTPNNELVIINSQTGNMALDKNNRPLFQWPATNTLLNAARVHKGIYDNSSSKNIFGKTFYNNERRMKEFSERHPFGYTYQ